MNEKNENVLYLPLAKKWFLMIKSGIKKEEYRSLTKFYYSRLTKTVDGKLAFKEYDTIEFTMGYPRKDETDRRIRYKFGGIRIGTGNPLCGAKYGQDYFVIKIGDRVPL